MNTQNQNYQTPAVAKIKFHIVTAGDLGIFHDKKFNDLIKELLRGYKLDPVKWLATLLEQFNGPNKTELLAALNKDRGHAMNEFLKVAARGAIFGENGYWLIPRGGKIYAQEGYRNARRRAMAAGWTFDLIILSKNEAASTKVEFYEEGSKSGQVKSIKYPPSVKDVFNRKNTMGRKAVDFGGGVAICKSRFHEPIIIFMSQEDFKKRMDSGTGGTEPSDKSSWSKSTVAMVTKTLLNKAAKVVGEPVEYDMPANANKPMTNLLLPPGEADGEEIPELIPEATRPSKEKPKKSVGKAKKNGEKTVDITPDEPAEVKALPDASSVPSPAEAEPDAQTAEPTEPTEPTDEELGKDVLL